MFCTFLKFADETAAKAEPAMLPFLNEGDWAANVDPAIPCYHVTGSHFDDDLQMQLDDFSPTDGYHVNIQTEEVDETLTAIDTCLGVRDGGGAGEFVYGDKPEMPERVFVADRAAQ